MTGALVLHRGRGLGILVALLGAWGALVPFIGPYFSYAYSPDKAWAYSTGRLWLSVLPGAAAFLGGLLIVASSRTAAGGGVLAALAGAWFVLGQAIVPLVTTSAGASAGSPVAGAGSSVSPATMRFLETLGFFYGLGIVIVFLAALAIGRAAVVRAPETAYADETMERDYGHAV